LSVKAGLAAGLMLVVTGACRPSEPAPPDRLTACEIVGRTEIARILERRVGAPNESSGAATDNLAGRSGCAWSSADARMAVLIELVRTGDMATSVRRTGFSAAARFAAVRNGHPDADQPAIDGAEAIYVEETASLHVLAGRSYVTIEVAATPPSIVRAIAVEIAVSAVARLSQTDATD